MTHGGFSTALSCILLFSVLDRSLLSVITLVKGLDNMKNGANVILAVIGLLIGCQRSNEYTSPTPHESLSTKWNGLDRLEFLSKHTDCTIRIGHLEQGLTQDYRYLEDSRNIAAVKLKELEEIKELHSSLVAILRDKADDEFKTRWAEIIERDGKEIGDLERTIKALNERYVIDRKRYVLKKNKYREHLLKGLVANGISEDHTYSDDRVVIYIDSLKVRKVSVEVVIKAYLIDSFDISENPIENYRWPGHSIYSPPFIPEAKIFVFNTRGESMGSPINATHIGDYETKGVTLKLTYQDDTQIGEGKIKLVLNEDVLSNTREVAMDIPYHLKEIAPPNLLINPDQITLTSPEKDFVAKIATITCKRAGDHLLVPVSLDIHGRSIQVEMVLDTGASITIVPYQEYQKGNAKPFSKLSRKKFETAKGTIYCYIDEVKVSTSAYSKTSLIGISNYDTPLLGVNYFQDNVFTVDVENECIYVHPRRK